MPCRNEANTQGRARTMNRSLRLNLAIPCRSASQAVAALMFEAREPTPPRITSAWLAERSKQGSVAASTIAPSSTGPDPPGIPGCYQRRRRTQRPDTQTQRPLRKLQTHRPGTQTNPRRGRGLRSKRGRGAGGRRLGRVGRWGRLGRPGRSGRPGRTGWASASVDAEVPTVAATAAPASQFRNNRRDSMSPSFTKRLGPSARRNRSHGARRFDGVARARRMCVGERGLELCLLLG